MRDIIRSRTREEEDLKKRQTELLALERKLAQRELDLATLQAELHAFEARYIRIVGALYWELDEIEARIAEVAARLHPDMVEVQQRAQEARARARQTAEAVGRAPEPKPEDQFKPTEDLRKLYREVAKRIHPDLTADDEERKRRNGLMAEANRAYADADEERLRAILVEWESSPEAVRGDEPESRLQRVMRKTEQAKKRLEAITLEMTQLHQSDLYTLKRRVERAAKLDRDLLAEMANRVRQDIEAATKRLQQAEREL